MQQKYHHYTSLLLKAKDDQILHKSTLIFNVEDALLRSSSLFPYFMLVAFEGGGPLRALSLLILYPLLCIIREELSLKIMVFVCFFGINKESFKIGSTVLPKFFLENVGHESLEVVMRFGRKVGVSSYPRVMVEEFLKDYLGFEVIFGREISVFCGYYTGFLVKNDQKLEQMFEHKEHDDDHQIVGIFGIIKTHLSIYCKDIFLVSKDDKKRWSNLGREKYAKPLIFHDGRLAFLPTPLSILAMFIWLPFGIILCIIRLFIGILLPYQISTPILSFLGVNIPYYGPKHSPSSHGSFSKGSIYVCNHRTLLDPVVMSQICQANLTSPVYGTSKVSNFLSPIGIIKLTRNKEKDAAIFSKVLSQGKSVVICPEGTTCREPYLLRFSPLFAELSDDITPVTIQVDVTMFHGTTANGIKAFDPFFFFMNPRPSYYVKFLDKLPDSWTCGSGGRTKFEVANYVQDLIGRTLGFKCTSLTRKDKYMMLRGDNGFVN